MPSIVKHCPAERSTESMIKSVSIRLLTPLVVSELEQTIDHHYLFP